MKVAIEISMYPIKADYEPAIIQFINDLKSNSELHVQTNAMSTQVFGEFDVAFTKVKDAIQKVFEAENKVVFNFKVLNNPLPADFKL